MSRDVPGVSRIRAPRRLSASHSLPSSNRAAQSLSELPAFAKMNRHSQVRQPDGAEQPWQSA
ncbi:MAG: hypothetical protein ACK52A_07570, partial [Planctomycetota bacterium]